jgi:lysophospholipase L1-like esterase
VLPLLAALVLSAASPARGAEPLLNCPSFTTAALAMPEGRDDPHALARQREINERIAATPHALLFLGDSLTEGWDAGLWQDHFGGRAAVNGGVAGDRTEHLLWRMAHGNLGPPAPRAVVLLIGTNDLAYGRSPELAAAGVRKVLLVLRRQLPEVPVLLLGLLPREAASDDPLRRKVTAVNRLLARCADDKIRYAEIGEVLLDAEGRLSSAIAPDRLHFSRRGYALLAPRLDRELDYLERGH